MIKGESMTSEKKQQIEVIARMLLVVVCASLYAWGGMEHRLLLRRILAPAVAAVTCFYFSRDWRHFILFPLLWISSSIGYGASEMWAKIIKRSYVGLAFGVSTSLKNIIDKRLILSIFQPVLLITTFVCFGVWNPFGSARVEESILGLLIYTMPIMSSKRRTIC